MKIQCFFWSLSKKLILWNALFFANTISIFLVLSLQKSIKFRCQNACENDIKKKGSKIEFGHRFWPPQTTKIAPKSDAKRSLFRDAVETARNSSEVNGPQRLNSVQRATHMIRSSPSIHWLFLGRPNQSLPVKWLTSSSKWIQKLRQNSFQNPFKILPKFPPSPPKFFPNPPSEKDAFQTRPKIHFLLVLNHFFKFLEGPGPPKLSLNR